MKTRKGILLTLVTLVLFILMLGELVTYIVISINYGVLSSTSSAASSSSAFLNYLSGSAPGFLSQSLAKALGTLALYEVTPSLRSYHFVNNTALALQGLMTNGIVYGTNMSSYMQGATLQNYISSVYGRASGTGSNLSLNNLSISVYQSSPFYVSARFVGSAILHSSVGTITYPIYQTANVSLNGTTDLLSAQNGNPIAIQTIPDYQYTNLIGNTLAASGTRSPFMFAYGTIIYEGTVSSCSSIPAAFQTSSYILAVPNGASVPATVCNMGGLVTNAAPLTKPTKPYLVYNGMVSAGTIPNGTAVLLNGAGLSLLGTSGLQTAIQRGYYFGSNYSPSYLQLSEVSTSGGSNAGTFSFGLLNRKSANFNGASSYVSIKKTASDTVSGNQITISAWIYMSGEGINCPRIIDGGAVNVEYTFAANCNNNELLWRPETSGGAGTIVSSPLLLDTWYNVVARYNGSYATIYIDGVSGATPVALTVNLHTG